jgi:hypothetical protein
VKLLRGRVSLLLAVACGATALAGCGHLDRDDLRSEVDQIRSDAADGMLLAEQATQHRVPVMFVWNHSAELHHATLEVRARITGEIVSRQSDPYMTVVRRELDRAAGALELLHQQPGNPAVFQRVRDQLAHVAADSQTLGDRIG